MVLDDTKASRDMIRSICSVTARNRGGVSKGYPPEFADTVASGIPLPIGIMQAIDYMADASKAVERIDV